MHQQYLRIFDPHSSTIQSQDEGRRIMQSLPTIHPPLDSLNLVISVNKVWYKFVHNIHFVFAIPSATVTASNAQNF
jgi:hypothetical protein